MREYTMPIDISEKEKIVGGYLTAMQGIYLGVGAAGALGLSFALKNWLGWYSFLVGIGVCGTISAVLAFVRIRGKSVFSYIVLQIQHSKKRKKLPNIDPEKANLFVSEREG